MEFEALLRAQGLDDNQIKAILGAMKKEKLYTTTLEDADEKYKKLKGEYEDLEGQLETSNKTIKGLKKDNIDNEELQKKINDHEDTIKKLKSDSEKKIKNLTLDSAISNALTKSKAKHADLLASKFDKDKLVVNEDGSVTGLDEQLKTFKENYKDMFEVSLGGGTPPNPDTPPSKGNSWEDFINNADNMTAEQIAEAYTNLK
ncbi:hypothetical protein KD33_16795 [Clostridium sp. NCR]|nr:hypothetical protein KD33_16795 [Clostridium sp. NCR]